MHPRALVVEDDRATREVLRLILEGEGLAVDAVNDGDAAIEHLKAEQYSLLLLDIVLPTVSGTDVMEYLQAHSPSVLTRTIVVTGLSVSEIHKLFPTVPHAFPKPVLPGRLRSAVRACLHRGEGGSADAVVVA
jgi:DNA-binding response OmpR family regulator